MFKKSLFAMFVLTSIVTQNIKAQEFINDKIDVLAGTPKYLMNCVIYKPANFSTTKKYPLVLFFHGVGEAGTDVNKMYNTGLPKVLKGGYKPSFDFIMIAVQHNSYSVDPKHLPQILDESYARFPNIDPTRIYLTGLSAGGNTIFCEALNVDKELPKRFAAMVVMSGAAMGANQNNFSWWKEHKTPLWAVVGNNDVSYRGMSQMIVDGVNGQVPGLASITIRPGVGHGGWDDVYNGSVKTSDGKTMWQWLYQFTRTASGSTGGTPSTNQLPVANAGTDKTISVPATNTIGLTGSGSDADGSIASYKWAEASGPAQFTLSSTTIATPVVSNLTVGTYIFRLTVTDNTGATAVDDVTIKVNSSSGTPSTPPPGNPGTPSTPGDPSSAKRMLIDIGATATNVDQWGKYWNSMTDARPGVRISNAKTTTNASTAIGLQVVNRIDGTFSTGSKGINAGTTTGIVNNQYPGAATSDFAFAHKTTASGKWKVFGLNAQKTYTIKFWGTKTATANYTIQIKRADEAQWQEYNASGNKNYNTGATFSFTGKAEMDFDIRTKAGSDFGYISIVDIMEL